MMAPPLFFFKCIWIDRNSYTSFILKCLLFICHAVQPRKQKLKNAFKSVGRYRSFPLKRLCCLHIQNENLYFSTAVLIFATKKMQPLEPPIQTPKLKLQVHFTFILWWNGAAPDAVKGVCWPLNVRKPCFV